MQLQESSIFDLWPWPWGQGHTKFCPVPSTSCDLFSYMYKVWSCYVKRFRRCNYKKVQYLTFDLDQYPLHHVTYSATKFEVVTSNGLGGDTFTRNVTDGRTDRLWHEINIPFFSKEKSGIAIYRKERSFRGRKVPSAEGKFLYGRKLLNKFISKIIL